MTAFTPGTRVTVKSTVLCHHRHGIVVAPPPWSMPDGRIVLVEFPDCDVWGDLPCEIGVNENELEVQS